MTKLLSPIRLVLALATVFTVSGCELYFGGHNDGDRWTYCGNDGYYVCQDNDCSWAGPRCPDDPNYTCTTNDDCAAGCFCADNGMCEEAGFCDNDSQCPAGYTCDEGRQSCVPDTNQPTPCTTDTDCPTGAYCPADTGVCTDTCTCTSDADAQAQGYANCDENRQTCEPQPWYGSCGAPAAGCNTVAPSCPDGQVPLTDATTGCYGTGCLEIGLCDVAPTCSAYQHEGDCLGGAGCTPVYTGLNCTTPTGASCTSGSANCTCTSFVYSSCRDMPQ